MGVRTLRVEDERRAERDRFTTREQELTRALDEARRPPTPAPTAPALVLHGHGTRDAGETPELKRTGAATIAIAVALPSGAAYASYQAVLRTPEGALVWEDAGLQPEGSSIRLAIPADALPPGDYVLTLAGRRRTGPAAELADHYFRVVG
jgi:hypothetical protein